MRLAVQHGRQLLSSIPAQHAVSPQSVTGSSRAISSFSKSEPWTCAPCRARLARLTKQSSRIGIATTPQWTRSFSTTNRVAAVERPDTTGPSETLAKLQQEQRDSSARAKEATTATKDESLPSHTYKQRWQLSKRAQILMDELLAKASKASHHVNTMTGTDYSGIEALRQAIIEQERAVRAAHATVTSAKEVYTAAHAQQAASQKEVVGLLERKQSWSAPDLERYMSLIRSEHLNEQSVQKAQEELAEAERALEEGRSELEKKERKQYHEEQIWSDTIRRNSTWVTFGLMGVNILLLLVSIAVFEPWRRRRLVREFRSALEEKSTLALPSAVVEKEVDEEVQPVGAQVEAIEVAQTALASEVEPVVPISTSGEDDDGGTSLSAEDLLPQKAPDIVDASTNGPMSQKAAEASMFDRIIKAPGSWAAYRETFQDMFSDRMVTLRSVDITTIALEGAATGVAVMGLLFVLFRPR